MDTNRSQSLSPKVWGKVWGGVDPINPSWFGEAKATMYQPSAGGGAAWRCRSPTVCGHIG
jgi:hypothetical protein